MLVNVEQFLSCSIWERSVEGLDRVRLLRYKAHLAWREKWCGVDPRLASNGRNLDPLRSSPIFEQLANCSLRQA